MQENADLVTFTEEILNGKLHFLCSKRSLEDIMDTFWMSYVCSIYVVFPRGKLLNHIVWKAFVFGVFWWKVSVFGVFLVCIFPHLDWKRRDTIVSPNVGKYGLEKLRIRTLFMQWHVTRILLFEEVFSNFLLSIWFFVAIYYLFLCSFYCRNEFPIREFLTYSLHISFHSFNKFYFSLMLYISLLVYLLLRLQFENPNEIYSKVFQIPATYIFDINWSVNISGCPENCSRGKLPACNFIKKETLAQVFSCEFCEISKNTFFYRTPLVAAFVLKMMREALCYTLKVLLVLNDTQRKLCFIKFSTKEAGWLLLTFFICLHNQLSYIIRSIFTH